MRACVDKVFLRGVVTRCFYEVGRDMMDHFLIIVPRLLPGPHKKIMSMSASAVKRSLSVLSTSQISTTLKQTLKSTSIPDSSNEHRNTRDHHHRDDKEDDHLSIVEELLFSLGEIQESERAGLRGEHVAERTTKLSFLRQLE